MKTILYLFVLLVCFLLPLSAWADMEIEIEFRLQPDNSGTLTRNQGITVEDDEVEVYLDGAERELDSSKVDTDALFKLVATSIQNFKVVEGERIRAPYIEVKMEFSGEDREAEVSHRYPVGKMPSALIELQKQYLDEVWQ